MNARSNRFARADKLRTAILEMVLRYGESERRRAYAFEDGNTAERDRHARATDRRFRAIQRLTTALRDMDVTS